MLRSLAVLLLAIFLATYLQNFPCTEAVHGIGSSGRRRTGKRTSKLVDKVGPDIPVRVSRGIVHSQEKAL